MRVTIEIIRRPYAGNDYLSMAEPVLITRREALSECIIYEPRGKRGGNKPMQRTFSHMRKRRMIAYDLETTNICEGTPTIKYLTAYADAQTIGTKRHAPVNVSIAIRGADRHDALAQCLTMLETYLLIPENNGARFVAWNGNKYDAMLLAQALLLSSDWELHPFLTRSKTLRGLRVVGLNGKIKLSFEFLDGMAMTGLDTVGMPLQKFLALFAPDYAKHDLDFSKEEFDADNLRHVAYAERDSEGLFHAMQACNAKMVELTGNDLQTTMGRAAIKYLISQMPEGKKVWRPRGDVFDVIHATAKRGGYVWIVKPYQGRVWKYDLNQAYAGAMRDCQLPCGSLLDVDTYQPGMPGVYRCVISRATRSLIPFYFKFADTGAANFTCGDPVETWLLSNEIEHLQTDGWTVNVSAGHVWADHFDLADMVSRLEQMRFTDPAGPSGPLGIMVKMAGNSSYGKTLERLDGISLVLARQQPAGYEKYDTLGDVPIYARDDGPQYEPYHQPQLGAFITAHVRIQVRQAALGAAEHFIYADTDSVTFSAPVTHLNIDPCKYGFWKVETAGEEYTIIAKKVYAGVDGVKHAKGLRTRELTYADFVGWIAGQVPSQRQLQRVNCLKMLGGHTMFSYLTRRGTDVRRLKSVEFDGNYFLPKTRKGA